MTLFAKTIIYKKTKSTRNLRVEMSHDLTIITNSNNIKLNQGIIRRGNEAKAQGSSPDKGAQGF
jgi:hypothetical protein